MSFLTVKPPDGDVVRFPIETTGIRIGRSSENELVVDDATVSRMHAVLQHRSDGDYVVDTGGRNGTLVNGRRIDGSQLLRRGDVIELGRTTLVYDSVHLPSADVEDTPWSPNSEATFISASDLALTGPRIAPESVERSLLPILLEADKELDVDRPLSEIFARVLDLAHRIVPFERGVLQTFEGGELVQQIARLPGGADKTIRISAALKERVLRSREAALIVDALDDAVLKGRRSIQTENVRSLMCVPLWHRDEVLGLLYVDDRRQVGRFNEQNLRFLTHLGNVAAMKIQNKRLFDQTLAAEVLTKELSRAAEIQSHLLPTDAPAIPGYRLAGLSNPCYMVGGDYFDFLELSGRRLGIAVADVAGKGLGAALLMCSLQSSVRSLAEQDLPPGELMTRLNRILCRQLPDNRMITMVYAILDPAANTLSYVNAGHNLPFIVGSGEARWMEKHGLPLGLFEDVSYPMSTAVIEAGELLVAYSDGIVEALNARNEEFGADRLVRSAAGAVDGEPERTLAEVLEDLDRHCQETPYSDDTTLVVLKRLERETGG